jgi:glutathione peroxidase
MTKLDFRTEVVSLDGTSSTLEAYRGKVMLIVNTASRCGFTPQFAGLEALHQELAPRGLVVLGFPCNQFGGQEPLDGDGIASFCSINYGVTFPMHTKIDVNGAQAHPLFRQLKTAAPGLLGTEAIKWNFTKFLVDAEGAIVRRYGSRDTPASVRADILSLLEVAA